MLIRTITLLGFMLTVTGVSSAWAVRYGTKGVNPLADKMRGLHGNVMSQTRKSGLANDSHFALSALNGWSWTSRTFGRQLQVELSRKGWKVFNVNGVLAATRRGKNAANWLTLSTGADTRLFNASVTRGKVVRSVRILPIGDTLEVKSPADTMAGITDVKRGSYLIYSGETGRLIHQGKVKALLQGKVKTPLRTDALGSAARFLKRYDTEIFNGPM